MGTTEIRRSFRALVTARRDCTTDRAIPRRAERRRIARAARRLSRAIVRAGGDS